MEFLVKVTGACVSVLICLRANQIQSKETFNNVALRHMDALRKMLQSLINYVLSNCFWIYANLSRYVYFYKH